MDGFMTYTTQGYYIELVCNVITTWMMVVLCTVGTVKALKCARFRNNTLSDSLSQLYPCLYLGLARDCTSHIVFTSAHSYFWDLRFSGFSQAFILSVMFCVSICIYRQVRALFAICRQISCPVAVLVKLRDRLNGLAFGTILFYNGFRHNQFLYNWLSLEPVAGHIPASARFILPSYSALSRRIS